MELLIIAVLVPLLVSPAVMTKWVQDNRTDRAYAAQGMVSPRYQERLAKLEKAGRTNTRTEAKERGPLRQYLAELYADAIVDLQQKHRAKREHRGPVAYDPNKPSLAQRFDTAVIDGIDRIKKSKGWDTTKGVAKTVGQRFVQPWGENQRQVVAGKPEHVEQPGICDCGDCNAKPIGEPVELIPAGRCTYIPPAADGVTSERRAEDNLPGDTYCAVRRIEVDAQQPGATDGAPSPQTPTPSTGATTMSAPTGEAVNYETTVNELEAQERELMGHVDHCAQALEHLAGAKASINNMQESYRATQAAAAATAEHLAAKNLDGATLAHAGTTVDALPAGVVDAMYDQLEEMEAVARERLAAAGIALQSVQANLQHVQAEYGDAHDKVAGNLGGDASFLDSSGGVTGGGTAPATVAAAPTRERQVTPEPERRSEPAVGSMPTASGGDRVVQAVGSGRATVTLEERK